MKRSLSVASLSVAALITLSACGSPSGGDMEGMGMGQESSAAAEYSHADAMFAQMMIPHHRQAVEMSEIILAKDGIDPQITDLATTIKDAQGPEIETMTGWLEAWNEPGQPEGGMEDHEMDGMDGMTGMMSQDQMAEFESAEGMEASRLFLESMTDHHEGAIDMARDAIDNGQNPEVIKLAETIVQSQQAEIDRMQQLLASL